MAYPAIVLRQAPRRSWRREAKLQQRHVEQQPSLRIWQAFLA